MYHIPCLSAAILHFLTGVFFHFITGADKKIHSVTGEPIAGVMFHVSKVDGTFVGEYKTGHNGYVSVTDVDPGFYLIHETQAAPGFILDETVKTVELKYNSTAIVEFANKPLNGLEIYKKTDSDAPLAGVEFTVKKGNSLIGVYKTPASGLIQLSDLEPGFYTVLESAGVEGYLLDPTPQTAELKSGDSVRLEFVNTKHSDFQLVKRDSVTKEPIPNVSFRIEKLSGERVGDYKTGLNGTVSCELEPGSYCAFETATISGYVLDTIPQTFEVKKGKPVLLEFENVPLSGLQIRKTDQDGKPLSGVKFSVEELSGKRIGSFTSDETGICYVPDLKAGFYVVTETAGLSTHKMDTVPHNVQVEAGKLNIVEFQNNAYPILLIKKIGSDTKKPLGNVRFRLMDKYQREIGVYTTHAETGRIVLTGMDEGTFYLQEVESAEGYKLDSTVREISLQWGKTTTVEVQNTPLASLCIKKITKEDKKPLADVEFLLYDSKNNLVGEYTTDNLGVIELPRSLPAGKYKLKEIKTHEDYVLDDQVRTVELKSGETTEIVIENERKTGRIQITKVAAEYNHITKDKKGALLKGAVFAIFDSANKVVDRIETDRHGIAQSKDLPLGTYGIREITSPKHYLLDDKVFYAAIIKHDDLVKFEVQNKPVDLSVTVQKCGNYEALSGQSLRYDFKDIRNASTVELDDFYFHDVIPTDAVRLTSISTGTWSERLAYTVLYKTNQRGYRVLKERLNSKTVYELDCRREALKLKNGEYITDIKFEFGTVQPDFHELTQPYLVCMANGNLENEYRFTNRSDVGGRHRGEWAIAKDAWVTVVYAKPKGKLPKTGSTEVTENWNRN